MNELAPVLYEESGRVACITINREKRKNALDAATLKAIYDALAQADANDGIRTVVIAGAGGSFCAGADLGARDTPSSAVEVIEEHYKPVFMRIAELSKPVIAAVNGVAAGAGSALALVCDLSVMAEDAYLLFAFSNLGLIPDCGANWLLERAIGSKRAYQIVIEGGRLAADDCLRLGLTNKVEHRDNVKSAAIEWAAELGERAPLSLSLTKTVMRQSAISSYSEIVTLEGELQEQCTRGSDFREGVTAFFEKRKPNFQGG